MPFNISHPLVPVPTTKQTAFIFRCSKWTEDSASQRGYKLAILSEHSGVHSSHLWWKLFWEHTHTQQEMELFTNTKSRCLLSVQINLIYFILQNSDSQKLGLPQFPMIIHYLCWDVSLWRIKVLPDSGSIIQNDENVNRKLSPRGWEIRGSTGTILPKEANPKSLGRLQVMLVWRWWSYSMCVRACMRAFVCLCVCVSTTKEGLGLLSPGQYTVHNFV